MGKGVCMYSVFLCWTRGERRCLRASASKGESKGCSSASSPLSQALLMLWLFSGRAKSKAAGQTPCHTFTRGPDFGHGRTTCCVARRRGAEPEVLICSTSLLSGSSESWSSSLGEELLAVLKGVDRKCSSWALPWQLCCQEQVSKTVAFVPGSGNPAGLLETWLIDRHRTPSFFRQKMAVHKKRFLRFIVFLLPVVLAGVYCGTSLPAWTMQAKAQREALTGAAAAETKMLRNLHALLTEQTQKLQLLLEEVAQLEVEISRLKKVTLHFGEEGLAGQKP
ncbi:uncharacterized protein LOC134163000 isoform X1 [Pezoporus occidentalis]|uniref:uncharacterized protein LOC134163000 isoform X1 n=1 Tax=Pezoporus occidentalis TaxID=407982 RepID=UPI002F911B8D